MIAITGANGHLGRGVVNQLLKLLPADQISVSVRDTAKAEDVAAQGVHVRHGDFADPASLVQAFAGAERVLLISTDVVGASRVALHKAAIDAAKQAGASHIVYTSIIEPDSDSPFRASADHVATEAYIRESGLHYTMLRNSFYADIVPMLAGGALAGGTLDAPADGPATYVARSDLAEATANLLASGKHVDEIVDLTGPEALDLAQIASIVSTLQNRSVERRVLPDAVYREGAIATGVPAEAADTLLGVFAALRQNRFGRVDPALAVLLGREPQTVSALLEQSMTVAAK